MSTGLLFCPDAVQGKAFVHGYASPGVCERGEGVAIAPAIATPSPSLSLRESAQPDSGESPREKWQQESTGSLRTAWAMEQNSVLFCRRHPPTHVGFLTFSFVENLTDAKEAQRRWNSIKTHELSGRYLEWIAVIGRQDRGAWHYHLLVALDHDIRTGFDHRAVRAGDYRSVCPFLLNEWAFWRERCPKYGFGRHELKPIKTRGEAISRYMVGYLGKHLRVRAVEDKGVRLVRYSKGSMRVSTRFAWNGPGGQVRRSKLRGLCEQLGLTDGNYQAVFKAWFGKSWMHVLNPIINAVRLSLYPSLTTLLCDYPGLVNSEGGEESLDYLRQEGSDFCSSGWINPDQADARQSLLAAWMLARNERQRYENKQKGKCQ